MAYPTAGRFTFNAAEMLEEVEATIAVDTAAQQLSVPLLALLREFNHDHDEQAIPYPLNRWDDRKFAVALRT